MLEATPTFVDSFVGRTYQRRKRNNKAEQAHEV